MRGVQAGDYVLECVIQNVTAFIYIVYLYIDEIILWGEKDIKVSMVTA